MRLSPKQTITLDLLEDHITNEIQYGGAAGGGKSILAGYWLTKMSLRYPETKWLLGRAKMKTLKETSLKSLFQVFRMQGITQRHFKYNGANDKENPNTIEFYNGSLIILKDLFYYPSDPEFDELGSLEITGAAIDENSQITEKCWNIVMSRIRHDVAKNGLIPKMFGSCNPTKNFVYSRFYKPYKDGKLGSDKAFIQALVTDNPFVDKFYIDNLMKLDPRSKERLLFGNWEYDDDPYTLMEYEKIVDLFTNSHVQDGFKYMTIDVARLGKDDTTIRIWSGLICIYKKVIPKCRIDDLATLVRKIQREYSVPNSNTIADEDGVGGGLVDILRCKGFVNNSRPIPTYGEVKNYYNLRSQCFFKLSELVNNNQIFLQNEPISERERVTKELEQIKQIDADKDSKLKVISKEQLKIILGASTDEADNLMMRMYFELKKMERRPTKKPRARNIKLS